MRLLLKNGRVIDPARGVDEIADVLVAGGRIESAGSAGRDIAADLVCDVSGLVVAPGLVDAHVHMREPGFEYKETIETAAMAAAAGGFTTIVGMPNTRPAIDTGAMVDFVMGRGRTAAVHVLTSGAATKANEGAEMAEIGDMVAAGAVAISDDAFPIQSANLMRRVMDYSKMFDIPILTHCEDKAMTADSAMNEGITCTILGLRPWPRQAEEIMIWRNIILAHLTGCKLHIQHITTAGGVEAMRWAKARGIRVTCETCPQYFSLTDEALIGYDTNAKTNPPLRTRDDVDAIKAALADGTIDLIATDHAPHAREDKEVELQDAAFGMVGLETAVPLVITNLVTSGVLSLSEAISKLTIEPARLLGLPAGTLSEGSIADIVLIDPDASVVVRSSEFKSLGRNTPFEGAELTGKVAAAMVSGEIVYGSDALKREGAKAGV